MPSSASLCAAKKPEPGEHRKVHRAEIMAKAGQRELSGLDRAARRLFGFDDRDRPSFFGEPNGRREAIVAGADHHRVI